MERSGPLLSNTAFLLPTTPSLLVDRHKPFIHRDLSWLQFNERVLAEARLNTNPILERAKFLAITASNLDEFFMIRLASLDRSIQQARRSDTRLERSLQRIRSNLLDAVSRFGVKQSETLELILAALKSEGIDLVRQPTPQNPDFEIGRKIFASQIMPNLQAPETFSTSQLANLENLQLGVFGEPDLWFRISKTIPQAFIEKTDRYKVFFLDDLIYTHLPQTFGLKSPPALIRLTRDADVAVDLRDDDTESLPDIMRSNLRSRDKGRAVRIQWAGNAPGTILQKAIHSYRIEPSQAMPAPFSLFLNGLWSLYNQIPDSEATSHLRFPALKSFSLRHTLGAATVFDKLKQKDFILHHPYDSFDSFVSWIERACKDPQVELIEQTIYRIDTLSKLIDALKAAAKSKRIRVIIELRARFDELNNLKLTEELRAAGVEVSFGFGRLKLHAKVALVSRREGNALKLYTHLSTGNYNAQTARQYTDLAILTSNAEIGADARHFFDAIWNGKIPTNFKQLVSAPSKLHRKLLSLIQAETEAARAGRKARIVAKVNALVDESLAEQLYEASRAGVQVDLIVRGACSLIPGVKGLSENIRVISIVDRFLEHSRIYYFGDSRALYLSSADWMPRNFFSRLELAFPILDPKIYQYIEEIIIPAYLLDTVKAKELMPQGLWKKRTSASIRPEDRFSNSPLKSRKALSAQSFFTEVAAQNYKASLLTRDKSKTT